MTYFKVKPGFDQFPRKDGSILIAHELYTTREMERYGINPNACEEVQISKRKVYFFFGARFAD